ncbi:MAG: alpha/beta hydrolase [Anaerolineaceae bacterium]|nr:alpha/beta hydrolase [Anaerolineaceae bacterium]
METRFIEINQSQIYFEQSGSGTPLIFIHGAFADSSMWDPQWEYFQDRFQVIRYDLRGHGKTGPSGLDTYQMETFVDDLAALMDFLDISSAIFCGVSFGGSIAQGFASRYPEKVKGLVLAGSMVSMSLTFSEKIQRYVLVPKWLMSGIIKSMSVKQFVEFSYFLSRIFFGKNFLSYDEKVSEYLRNCMVTIDSQEYLKIWQAIYGFNSFPLERITSPTLVLNGEKEPKRIINHSKELIKRIPLTQWEIIAQAKHSMNMENAKEFNRILDEFIRFLS